MRYSDSSANDQTRLHITSMTWKDLRLSTFLNPELCLFKKIDKQVLQLTQSGILISCCKDISARVSFLWEEAGVT